MPVPHNPYQATSRASLPPPAPLTGRRPRVLASVPRYLPEHNAGAEATLHAILVDLVAAGWDATVASKEWRGNNYTWDGVNVIGAPRDADMRWLWEWADVGVTHLHGTRSAMGWARRGRPLVHLVHNHSQLQTERVPISGAQLVVWNSRWIAEQWEGRNVWPGIVVHPPVDPEAYRTENPDRALCGTVTLLNITEVKGGGMFWRLVARRPDLPFLGVEGAYYLQERPSQMPRNAEVIENQVDVRPVYERTRVLLVPSKYESYGRVAIEAAASGIPVIASRTPGLLEAGTSPTEGECFLFADDDDEDAWAAALDSLDDPRAYAEWSRRSTVRSGEVTWESAGERELLRASFMALAEGRSLAGQPGVRPAR